MLTQQIKQLLTAFIVGSSWISFALFFLGFHTYKGKFKKNNCLNKYIEPYYFYTLFAPVYMGIMSVIAVYIHQHYNMSIEKSFIIISLVSPVIVSVAITMCDIYNFNQLRLIEQYARLIIYHSILFNLVILPIIKKIIN